VKYELSDKTGSCEDYKTSSSTGDNETQKWLGS